MSIFKKVINYFTADPKNADNKRLPSEQAKKNEETQQTVLKSLFTKTDPHTITKFPYVWTKEFLPPLDERERKFMTEEILRWHSIFLEVAFEEIVELITFFISKQPNSEDVVDYSKQHKNEYEFILIETMHLHYLEIVKKRLDKFTEVKLLKWQPVQGEYSYEPENEEYMEIIESISKNIMKEVRVQIKHLEEEHRLIQMIKEENNSVEVKQNSLTDHIKILLTKNYRAIVKNAFDKLIYEKSMFPNYKGDLERHFDNDLFNKYSSAFADEEGNSLTFYQIMEKVHSDIEEFLSVRRKEDILNWIIKTQWSEFENFMLQEYQDISDEDIQEIDAANFTVYRLSLDFFTIIIFSIYLDGIPFEKKK